MKLMTRWQGILIALVFTGCIPVSHNETRPPQITMSPPTEASPVPGPARPQPPENPPLPPPPGNNPFANVPTGPMADLSGVTLTPSTSEWNRDVTSDAVDPNSQSYTSKLVTGTGQALTLNVETYPWGYPYEVVAGNSQSLVPINFWPKNSSYFYPPSYPNSSDPNPFANDVFGKYPYHLPIPSSAPIEPGSDHHLLIIDKDNAWAWEMWLADYDNNPSWTTWKASTIGPIPTGSDGGFTAANTAGFDLLSPAFDVQRTFGLTSADAAGLLIMAGVARYDEVVLKGEIDHALRFTLGSVSKYVTFPAEHSAPTGGVLPMGARLRLSPNFDLTPYSGPALVILKALQKYGMFLADTGGQLHIMTDSNPLWGDCTKSGTVSNQMYYALKNVKATDFEVLSMPEGYAISGPASINVGSLGSFTVTLNSNLTNLNKNTLYVFLFDNGAGGTFTNCASGTIKSLAFTGTTTSLPFCYQPNTAGTVTLSTTNNNTLGQGILIDPPALSVPVK